MPLLISPLRSGEGKKKKKKRRGPVSSHLPGAVVRVRGERGRGERKRTEGRKETHTRHTTTTTKSDEVSLPPRPKSAEILN